MKREWLRHARVKPLLSQERAKNDARKVLEMAGIRPRSREYALLSKAISGIQWMSHRHDALIRDYGRDIAALATRPITARKLEFLQRAAADLQALNLTADLPAVLRLAGRVSRVHRAGGYASALSRAAENEARDKRINACAEQLMKSGKKPRDLNGILGKRFGLTSKQIGNIRRGREKQK